MGWNYVMQWAFVLPLELTVCGGVVQYWAPDINVAVWVTVSCLVAIVASRLDRPCAYISPGISGSYYHRQHLRRPWICGRRILGGLP